MEVAHLIDSISPEAGGPPRVMLNLAAAQVRLGIGVQVVTRKDAQTDTWWSQWCERTPALSSIPLRALDCSWYATGARARAVRALGDRANVLHVHGIWKALAWQTLANRSRFGAAVLLAPHGMLSPWSLNHHRLKKSVALRLGWRRMLTSADAFHAVSAGEEVEIAAAVPGSQIAVLPNGVAPVDDAAAVPAQSQRANVGPPSSRYVLFLARLHVMKGPDLLLEAFARLIRQLTDEPDLTLVMAGPDYGMRRALESQARRLRMADRVRFLGAVFGREKWDLIRGAALCCQPSRYEAFSLSLLESLEAGVPVVTTPEANVPDVALANAGIVCQGEPEELAQAMLHLLTHPQLRVEMGQRGRAMVYTKYTWSKIAKDSAAVYEALWRRAGEHRGARASG
ncbi:MAG TPA: glycosyltransferase [Steroidobacteraceae bacterium]|nr:glycosyltransferase [Steroidobacteraceae bacterium]